MFGLLIDTEKLQQNRTRAVLAKATERRKPDNVSSLKSQTDATGGETGAGAGCLVEYSFSTGLISGQKVPVMLTPCRK